MQSSSEEASQDTISHAELVISINKLARLAIFTTLAFGVLLLTVGRQAFNVMPAGVIVAIVAGIAVIASTAIAAMACLALWKR